MPRELVLVLCFGLLAPGCADEPAVTPAASATSGSEAHRDEVGPRTVTAAPPFTVTPRVHDCIRAANCCEAYVNTMVSITPEIAEHLDPVTVCTPIGDMASTGPDAEPACKAAIVGWSESIRAVNVDVPSACR